MPLVPASFLILLVLFCFTTSIEIDPSGYLVYCPCMGRFGNQAEQFLGTLHFARHLNRTLVLPPFIEYDHYGVKLIPFDEYIQVEPLRQYHRVILMADFLRELAPIIWNESNRSIACYSPRSFSNKKSEDGEEASCNAFEGSPFKEFWHSLNVHNFPAGSLYYQPLHTDYNFVDQWDAAYKHIHVLTFVGAPSSFPAIAQAIPLQQYIHFSHKIASRARAYRVARDLEGRAYLSIHIRHGTDWSRACDLITSNPDLTQLFSSQQCLDVNDRLTYQLCMPSPQQIISDIRSVVSHHNEAHASNPIRHVHISTDHNNESLWRQIYDAFDGQLTVLGPQSSIAALSGEVSLHPSSHFTIDLYLMSHADQMLANCVSSFSAFATRYRLHRYRFHSSTNFLTRVANQSSSTRIEL